MFDGTLSQDDLARITAERDRWMSVGLSTERCDRPRAEVAVRAAYTAAGIPEPEVVVWMDSPLGGALATAFVKELARGQLWDQLRGQLRGQLWDQLGDQLGDQLRGQLWDQLDPWWEAYWLAFYTCALPLADLSSARLETMAAAQAEVAWWWPMQGAVVLTDRPTVARVDQQVRWHCEDGPAVAYADGWSLYFWHGVPVPADLIEKGWPVDRILKESNAEVRRCAIERQGWDWFIREAGLRSTGRAVPDPGNPGHFLALYDLPDGVFDEPVRVLLCDNATPERDGTRRRFGLTVPASIHDPVAAAAWTFGLNPSEYAAMERAS